jgi:hypothetical protein
MNKHTHLPTGKLVQLHNYTPEERLVLLTHICHQLYIARNISSNQTVILDNLKKIDTLFSSGPEIEIYKL